MLTEERTKELVAQFKALARPKVLKGIAALDKWSEVREEDGKWPWRNYVPTSKLKMGSCNQCIMGWVHPSGYGETAARDISGFDKSGVSFDNWDQYIEATAGHGFSCTEVYSDFFDGLLSNDEEYNWMIEKSHRLLGEVWIEEAGLT